MSTNNTQDNTTKPQGWSWGFGRAECAKGESTPLLPPATPSKSSQDPVKESPHEPRAPPPSSAPPPPPKDDTQKSSNAPDDPSQSQHSQKLKPSARSKRRKNVPDPTIEAATAAATHIKKTITKSIKKKFEGPRKGVLHVLLDLLRLLAGLSSAMMLGMQVVPLCRMKRGDDSEIVFGLQVAVRIYIIIFCLFFVLVEARLPFFKRFFSGLNWILRGFLYSFIGIIGMEQDLAIKVEDFASSPKSSILGPDYMTMFASLFMSLTTWLMISVGILYMILGLGCMQRWYERMANEHREKVLEWKREKKMEADFKQQKEEYKQYEADRLEGRGEWYDDLPNA